MARVPVYQCKGGECRRLWNRNTLTALDYLRDDPVHHAVCPVCTCVCFPLPPESEPFTGYYKVPHRTSIEAGLSLSEEFKETARQIVFSFIWEHNNDCVTSDLRPPNVDLNQSTAWARFGELLLDCYVRYTTRVKKTASNRDAQCLEAFPEMADVHANPTERERALLAKVYEIEEMRILSHKTCAELLEARYAAAGRLQDLVLATRRNR